MKGLLDEFGASEPMMDPADCYHPFPWLEKSARPRRRATFWFNPCPNVETMNREAMTGMCSAGSLKNSALKKRRSQLTTRCRNRNKTARSPIQLTLFIDAQDDNFLGWVQIQRHHVGQFFYESGIAGKFERLTQSGAA